MSGQWEVVGKKKNKDIPIPNKKSGGENKKKSTLPSIPKVEDVLPSKEVKSLFSTNKNKENRKPVEKVKVQENGTKKVQKKVEKPQEPAKPKQPKSIEGAFNLIKVEEFKALYENNKQLFPDAPLIWLKELVQFLNHHVPIELQDPIFSTKPDNYPFSAVPGPLRNVIEKSIKEAGHSNTQLFFDMSLTAMANDMGKNASVIGYKLYIQYLAVTDPQLVITNLSKHTILRNSYQNRQPIGLSILWGLGQAALKDLNVGLKVFQEIMLPVIEMKSYSRYVVQYLISLINRHGQVHINKDQYLLVLDVAFANYKNFPTDLRKQVQSVVEKLEFMLVAQSGNEKCHTYIEPLLKKMLSNNSNGYKDEICKTLTSILSKDQIAFSSWSKCYTKYLPQSAILLTYMGENWNILSKKFNKTAIIDILNMYQITNEELLSKKRKEPGLAESVAAIEVFKDRLTNLKMVSSHTPYKCTSLLLFAIIGTLLYYDVQQNGSWGKSVTYRGLKNYGVVNYSNNAIERSREGLQWLHIHIDEQFPGYYEKSAEILQPYGQLLRDLGIVGCNHLVQLKKVVVEKYYPSVVATIDTYAPGLCEASQKAVSDAWSTSVIYYTKSTNYLKKEVFVGQLAPENMQRVILEAFNTTQQKAAQCYNWIYEKVQSTIK